MTSQQKELECLKSGNTSRTELLKEKKNYFIYSYMLFLSIGRGELATVLVNYIFFLGFMVHVYTCSLWNTLATHQHFPFKVANAGTSLY